MKKGAKSSGKRASGTPSPLSSTRTIAWPSSSRTETCTLTVGPARRSLDRVLQEVVDRACARVFVAGDVGGPEHLDRDAHLSRPGLELRDAAPREIAEITRLARDLAPAADEEKIGHQSIEALDFLGDGGEIVHRLGGDVGRRPCQIDAELHRRERVPDLVRDARDDLAERDVALVEVQRAGELVALFLARFETAGELLDAFRDSRELGEARARDLGTEVAFEVLEGASERARVAARCDHGAEREDGEEQRDPREHGDRHAPRL